MGATLKRLIALTLTVALAATLSPAAAFASDGKARDRYGAAATALDDTPPAAGDGESADAQPLSMAIEYDQPVEAGVPTVFTMVASGGAGEYKYRPHSLNVLNGGSWDPVVDFSFTQYGTANTFEFTFAILGTYRLGLSVFDRIPGTTQYQYKTFYTEFEVRGGGITAAERNRLAAEKADAVWNACQVAGCTTEYERALWLHDWVIDHCDYDRSLRYYQAADLLLDGRGTCEAYHAAYTMLLQRAGIQCGRVQDSGHVWTSVRIDGRWYHVDTTHDDVDDDWFGLGEANRRLFFALDDATIQAVLALENHRIEREEPAITASDAGRSFFAVSGAARTYGQPFLAAVQQNLDAGRTSFDLAIPHGNWPSSYQTLVYRPTAHWLSSQSWKASGKPVAVTAAYADGRLSFSVAAAAASAPTPQKTSLSKARISGLVSKAYTGKRITQKPVVKLGSKTLKLNRDYTLSFKNNLKRGKATVTVKGKGSYTGSKSASFRIMRYKQPMKCSLKAKAKTVKAAKVSKAPVSLPKPFTVKKAKGKVGFSNISSQKGAKAFKVNSRTGTVTIPKMTKKGTYLLKVKIQAAGSSPYAYGSRNLVLKVHIR